MAYSAFDTPGEFFNASTLPIGAPVDTSTSYTLGTGEITIGTVSNATSTDRFLTNLTDAQANATTGSTAQVVFGITDAIYQRFNSIPAADKPTKFSIVRTGYTDETTGELVYNYTTTIRVTPGSLTAVNS